MKALGYNFDSDTRQIIKALSGKGLRNYYNIGRF